MPVIRVDGPSVRDLEKRREFVRRVTEAASDYYGMPVEKIIVIVRENDPHSVAVGGGLVGDRETG